jgi:hypothetical protein
MAAPTPTTNNNEAEPAWEMPGPSMERLGELLKQDPSLVDLAPLPEVKQRVSEAGCCIDIIRVACEVGTHFASVSREHDARNRKCAP